MGTHRLSPQRSGRPALTLAVSNATVGSIMTKNVITVRPGDRLYLVQQLLQQNRIHHLLVEEARQLIGVISDRDVLSAISPFLETPHEDRRDTRTMHLRARDIMTPDPICAQRTTTIEEAATLLLRHTISCLPVVGSERMVEGVVTWKDILRYYVKASESHAGGTT